VFPKNRDIAIIDVLMCLSPDGTAEFLSTKQFWDALELLTELFQIFDSRRRRRAHIARARLHKAPRKIQHEVLRILERAPTIQEELRAVIQ